MKTKTRMNTMKKVSAVLGMVMAMNTIAATGIVASADVGDTTSSTGRTAIVAVGPSTTSGPATTTTSPTTTTITTTSTGTSSGGSGSNDDFSDWEQPNEKDVEEAKRKAEKEQEKKEAKEEAAREKRQEIINQGGAIAGDYVANLITGKYENSDQAKKAALNAAGKIFKDCVLKNIPYAGGFVSSVFGGIMGMEEPDPMEGTNKRIDETNKKLDITNEHLAQVNKNLQEINSSITRTGTMLKKTMTDATTENGYIASMNASAKTMEKLYNEHNVQVAQAMANIYNSNGKITEADDDVLSYVFSYGNGNARDTSVNGYNLEYYNAFIDFDNSLKNNKFMNGFDQFGAGKNIFEINDMTIYDDYMHVDDREHFLNTVSEFYSTGYEVLTSAMQYEKEKLALSNCIASSQLVELEDMKANTVGDTSEIDAEIAKYDNEVKRTNIGLTDLNTKLDALKKAYDNFNVMVGNQQTKLDSKKQQLINNYNKEKNGEYDISIATDDWGNKHEVILHMPSFYSELAEKWIKQQEEKQAQQQAQQQAEQVQNLDTSAIPDGEWQNIVI